MSQGIVERPFSRRSAVHRCQVELFALLARELIEAYTRRPQTSLADWFDLPEYRRFIVGAYAAGFVCTDLAPMKNFDEMSARPHEHLGDIGFGALRHWIHSLLRTERWADGFSSPIREAIASEALGIVADRLSNDGNLKQQEELTDEAICERITETKKGEK